MGVVGVRGVRFLLAGVGTTALAVLGVACGADGPQTELERGASTFASGCAQCHGVDLAGTELGPSLLDPVYGPDQLTDAAVVDSIRNGIEQRLWDFGPMPANPGFSDERIDAVVTFVRAQQADAAARSAGG